MRLLRKCTAVVRTGRGPLVSKQRAGRDMSWHRRSLCWCLLLLPLVVAPRCAAAPLEQCEEWMSVGNVSCSGLNLAPTALRAYGLDFQVVPAPNKGSCEELCDNYTKVHWDSTEEPCRLITDGEESSSCEANVDSIPFRLRCSYEAAQAFVWCDPPHERRRRQEEATLPPEDESESEPSEAATENPPSEAESTDKVKVEDDEVVPASTATDEPTNPPPTENASTATEQENGETTTLEPEQVVPAEGGSTEPSAAAPPEEVGPEEAVEETDWESTLTIALAALIGVLVVGVGIGLFIFCRWRRTPMPTGTRAPGDGAEEKPLSRRVAASALEAYVMDALRSEELRDQHAQLPRGSVRPALCARRPDNRRRNRYNDLVAYDDTRVVLKPFPGEEPLASDYINANYIDGYACAREFIAAQAPLAHTAADLWRLLWQEGVRVVVTLCAAREAGVDKCFQYWPAAGSAVAHGPIAVTCAREDAYPDLMVREMRAALAGETRQVVQIQFTGWPDHGVPRHPEAVTALLRRVSRARVAAARAAGVDGDSRGAVPLLVHCSAGVGRTGTVLLAMCALAQARAEGAVDMLALLQRMRRQRPNLVDQAEQYEMAHRVLVDALLGSPLVWPADASLGARVREAAASGELRAQWRRLDPRPTASTPTPQYGGASTLGSRVSSSLSSLAASAAGSTPQLTGSGTPSLLEIDGYRARARFVAMPAAAPASAWRQVAARGLRVAVLLQECPEGEGPWPAAPPAADVGVRLAEADSRTSLAATLGVADPSASVVAEQRLELRAGGSEWRTLRLFRARSRWTASATVPEGGARPFLKLWAAVTDAAASVAPSAGGGGGASPAPEPVLLLCADGRRGCGLFAALSALLEQMQAEGEVCVAEAVHTARRAYDGFICSEEQLFFLYEASVLFVEDALAAGNKRKTELHTPAIL